MASDGPTDVNHDPAVKPSGRLTARDSTDDRPSDIGSPDDGDPQGRQRGRACGDGDELDGIGILVRRVGAGQDELDAVASYHAVNDAGQLDVYRLRHVGNPHGADQLVHQRLRTVGGNVVQPVSYTHLRAHET